MWYYIDHIGFNIMHYPLKAQTKNDNIPWIKSVGVGGASSP